MIGRPTDRGELDSLNLISADRQDLFAFYSTWILATEELLEAHPLSSVESALALNFGNARQVFGLSGDVGAMRSGNFLRLRNHGALWRFIRAIIRRKGVKSSNALRRRF